MSDVAVVVFPGSNCDRDAFHVFQDTLKRSVTFHWHDEPVRPDYRMVILPGGFSYGDYLRAGAMAKISPAVRSLGEYIERGGLVLGICNGFQILVEAGFLPGALVKNASLRFQCHDVHLRVETNGSPFLSKARRGEVLRMPIAHSEGRYIADEGTIAELEKGGRVLLRYCGPNGEISEAFNANGSTNSIAGITNAKGNVFGLMPHPERCSDAVLGNTDGLTVFRSIDSTLFL
jgi:phosphoribosylformylglycinamidine synthase subunit PurQ / glutaminase